MARGRRIPPITPENHTKTLENPRKRPETCRKRRETAGPRPRRCPWPTASPPEPRGRAGAPGQHPPGQRRAARRRRAGHRRRLLPHSHQVVYQSILGLHEQGKAIDAITLVDDLIRRDQLQLVGGHEAISQILNSVPHAANARYYAEIVRQKAIGRLLIDAANEILRDGYSNNFTAEQLLAAAERKVSDIAVGGAGLGLGRPSPG